MGQAGQAFGLLLIGITLGIFMAGTWVQSELGIVAATRAGLGELEGWAYISLAGFVACFAVAFASEWYEQRHEGGEAVESV